MKNNHLGHVTEDEPRGACALSPFDILGELDSCKLPSLFVVRTSHDQIPGSAISMSFDKHLETVTKNVLIGFNCRESVPITTPDPNIPPENRSLRQGTNSLKSSAEPVAMRATIGIDECNDVTGRELNPEITRGAGSRL